MKQLTKEQHDAILEWVKSITDVELCHEDFIEKFPPSCCDSCADGEHCESDSRLKAFTVFTEAYDETKSKVDEVLKHKQTI